MFDYEEDEVAQKLYNMMQIADGMRYDRGFAAWFISHGDITNRNKAVNWIKIVCFERIFLILLHNVITYSRYLTILVFGPSTRCRLSQYS